MLRSISARILYSAARSSCRPASYNVTRASCRPSQSFTPAVHLPTMRHFSGSAVSCQSRAEKVAQQYVDCVNNRDIDSLLKLLDESYHSDQPLHPGRSFTGLDIVRENHNKLFQLYEVIKVSLTSVAATDNQAWVEINWKLQSYAGARVDWKGVIIFGLKESDDKILWGRLYVESVGQEEKASSGKKRSLVEQLVNEATKDAKAGYQKMKSSMDMP